MGDSDIEAGESRRNSYAASARRGSNTLYRHNSNMSE